jgi:glucosamine 6-phosphate synthetase-like amidotransferase/phosphosugar isomerase protein
MCSIFGIGFMHGHEFDSAGAGTAVVSRLLKEAEAGGIRASGVAIMRRKNLGVLRRPIRGSDLAKSDEYKTFMDEHMKLGKAANLGNPVTAVIGHARTPTVGDPSNNYNNHPVVTGHIAGVHNGGIGNHHAIFKKFSKLDRIAQVDTEAIFQLIAYFTTQWKSRTVRAIQKASKYLVGGYACGMLNARSPFNLYLFRNSMPTKVLYYSKMGIVAFATQERFIHEAFKPFKSAMGKPVEIIMPTDSGIAFNLFNKSICTFKLHKGK